MLFQARGPTIKPFSKKCRPPWLSDEKIFGSRKLLKQLIGVQL